MITVTAEDLFDLKTKLRELLLKPSDIGTVEKVSNGVSIHLPREFKGEKILISYDN